MPFALVNDLHIGFALNTIYDQGGKSFEAPLWFFRAGGMTGDLVPALKDLKHDIGNMLNKAIAAIEDENDSLAGVLKNNINFNEIKGKTKIPDQKWKDLLDHFNQPNFVLVNDNFEFPDLLGAASEYLIKYFADSAGKKGGEFFTPTPLVENALKFLPIDEISQNLSKNPSHVLRVGDPTAGSNTFLVKFHEAIAAALSKQGLKDVEARQFAFFAQELKNTQVGLGVFNMFYHGLAKRLNPTETELHLGRRPEQGGIVARINGNSISEYTPKIGEQSGKLDVVVANPPYGTDDYGVVYANSARNHDGDRRWTAGVPTRSEGEWSFIQTITDLLSPSGVAVIVLPLGVLFRDGGKDFRQWLIEKDWLEGIVAAPSNQFLTTSIPVCLMVLNKNKKKENKGGVYFINASNDFTKVGKFNQWNEERAVNAWKTREEIPHYSGFVEAERLRKANYTLSVNRFFAPPQEKIQYDPNQLLADIQKIEEESKARVEWLNDVFKQASRIWVKPESDTTESLTKENDKNDQ